MAFTEPGGELQNLGDISAEKRGELAAELVTLKDEIRSIDQEIPPIPMGQIGKLHGSSSGALPSEIEDYVADYFTPVQREAWNHRRDLFRRVREIESILQTP